MTRKKILSGVISILLVSAMVSGVILPGAVQPIHTRAATSVYDFNYGDGISWPADEQLPIFSEPTPTKSDPTDAFLLTNSTTELDYLTVSLQGLVNRVKPRILLLRSADEGTYTWVNELVGEGNYKTTTDYRSLLRKYKSYIKGLVVYDPDQPATMNVATSIAGVEDCIIASPSNVDTLKSLLSVDIKVDLRDRFDNMLEAYNFLYENYYATGKLNKRLLIGVNPTDHKPTIRDLAVATKSAVLWLEPDNADEKAVLDKFYDEATPGVTYHVGWMPQEDSGVRYCTQKGVSFIPADWYDNMTYYSGQSKELELPETPEKPKLENKIYVAFALSDGDNTQYVEHFMKKRWMQKTSTSIPIAWTCTPAMYYFGPQMLNSYYKTLDNHMLICGPSGFGYTRTTRWREKEGFLDAYVDATDDLFERTGFNIITMWDRISEGTYEEFSSKTKSVLGVSTNNNGFNDADRNNPDSMYNGRRYSYYPSNGAYAYKNNLPIIGLGGSFGYVTSTNSPRDALRTLAESFDGTKPEFRFSQLVAWDVSPNQINQLALDLNAEYPGKFKFVRADHLFMLMNEYNNVPYNVALQKETNASFTDSTTTTHAATDGSFSTGWSAKNGTGAWFEVDLGSDYEISRYTLKNAGLRSDMDKTLNTKAFTVQTSLDGATWTPVSRVSNNTENVVYKDITKTIARYVRVEVNDPGADGVARIQDFEVYGNEVTVELAQANEAISEAEQLTQGTASDYKWNIFKDALATLKDAVAAGKSDKYTELVSALRIAEEGLKPENDIAATAINIPKTLAMELGSVKTFDNLLTPANSTDKITEWKSSNPSVLQVENGILTALELGDATVTVKTERGLTATMLVTVKILVRSITLDKTSLTMNIGDVDLVQPTLTPLNATNPGYSFSSSNYDVADVTPLGEVFAYNAGTATITVTADDDSSIRATCVVTVLPNPPEDGPTTEGGKTVLYKDGQAVSGTTVVKVDGKTYAVVKGYVATGKVTRVVTIGKKTYVVNKAGVVQRSGKNKLIRLNAKESYIVDKNGVLIKGNKLVTVGKKTYIVNKKGLVQKNNKSNKLVSIGKKSYIVNKAGVVQKGKKKYTLVKISKKSYIVNKTGVVQKNKKKVKVGKKTYKTNKKGVATKIK